MRVLSVAGLCASRRYGRLITVCALIVAVGCSAGSDAITVDSGGPSTGAAVYIGSFASATESGTMTLSLAAASTGTMVQVNGTTTALSGSYSASTGAVSLSGGGFTYTGILANGALTGTFRSAKSTGAFTAQSQTVAATPPKAFCGSYVSNTDYGWINFVASSTGSVTGFAVSGSGGINTSVPLTGTLTGSALTATTSTSTAISGVVSTDGTTLNGSYIPNGNGQSAPGTILAASTMCGTSSGVTAANSVAGYWGSDASLSTVLNVVFTQIGTSVAGSGAIHITNNGSYTGNFFRILSGSFNGQTVSFTAQLGANPVGDGTFWYGSLTYTGTESSSSTATGILTYTPPRTLTQSFPTQAVAGVTITR